MPDLLNILRGYLMGAADVVPGVSGGTVALAETYSYDSEGDHPDPRTGGAGRVAITERLM